MSNGSTTQTKHDTTDNAPKRADARMTIEVKVTRDLGDIQITYGAQTSYIVANYSELQACYDELRSHVENQFELAWHNRPALMPHQLKDTVSANEEIIHATHIRREFVEGKFRLRLVGGQYSTHGVAVYPEYHAALGINPDGLELGDTPYGQNVVIQIDGRGNPKKALRLVSINQD